MNRFSRINSILCPFRVESVRVVNQRLKNDESKNRELERLEDVKKFDEVTHTGQAWDEEDRRLARFTYSKKWVNPNVATHLIAEQKPILSNKHIVHCDGGHPALGHPKVYINLDKPGTHACGYCGLRFYNPHFTTAADLENIEKAQIQV